MIKDHANSDFCFLAEFGEINKQTNRTTIQSKNSRYETYSLSVFTTFDREGPLSESISKIQGLRENTILKYTAFYSSFWKHDVTQLASKERICGWLQTKLDQYYEVLPALTGIVKCKVTFRFNHTLSIENFRIYLEKTVLSDWKHLLQAKSNCLKPLQVSSALLDAQVSGTLARDLIGRHRTHGHPSGGAAGDLMGQFTSPKTTPSMYVQEVIWSQPVIYLTVTKHTCTLHGVLDGDE